MIMNFMEILMMNNPVRAFLQKNVWARIFFKYTPQNIPVFDKVLEIGCWNGTWVRIIFDLFQPKHIDALDLDPYMVKLAIKRTKRYKERVTISTGTVSKIKSPDENYDSVFGFWVLHHIPDWRWAVSEVNRVLKPNWLFYSEESFADFITHPFWRSIMSHIQEDRFNPDEYIEYLCSQGFELIGSKIADRKSLRWKLFRQSLWLMVFRKIDK